MSSVPSSEGVPTPILEPVIPTGVSPTPVSPARRNNHLAELVIQDLTPKPKAKKRRMVNRTYSIAPDDEDEITRLVDVLSKMKAVSTEINESLLVRVAISILVDSTKSIEGVSALIEAIEGRIKVERKAGVGAGRRRPKKKRVL